MSELDELDKQIAELNARRQVVLDEERAKTLKDVRNLVQRFEFTANELGITGSVRTKRKFKEKKPVTFRDASDPEKVLEWDGELKQKGRKPQWIKDRVADGTIEQYRV